VTSNLLRKLIAAKKAEASAPIHSALIGGMATVRMTEAELARDLHAVLAKVQEADNPVLDRHQSDQWHSS